MSLSERQLWEANVAVDEFGRLRSPVPARNRRKDADFAGLDGPFLSDLDLGSSLHGAESEPGMGVSAGPRASAVAR